ncbi:hypothetical protein F3Y22_tig00111215pilonHSYRG00048 [Hibiscus syriacus]|uniref:Uncharacterized protein n=1 Tax=Hibiscus syriacus TaxID=106335 RepID=A0A6A2YUU8_HIBSY|nr:hypothetical protein F3Y22_tig00111215pilonHSYRG00048 [Hibiscus syriacus]
MNVHRRDRDKSSVGLSTASVLFKRPKVAVSAWPYSPLQWRVLELKPASSIEGLDLELRLGVSTWMNSFNFDFSSLFASHL